MRRKRYDRAEVLSDPGMALRRAAGRAAFEGAASFGKGIFGLGATFMQHVVAKTATTTVVEQQQDDSSSSFDSKSEQQHVSTEQIAQDNWTTQLHVQYNEHQ